MLQEVLGFRSPELDLQMSRRDFDAASGNQFSVFLSHHGIADCLAELIFTFRLQPFMSLAESSDFCLCAKTPRPAKAGWNVPKRKCSFIDRGDESRQKTVCEAEAQS